MTVVAVVTNFANGQRPRFDDFFELQPPATTAGPLGQPPANLVVPQSAPSLTAPSLPTLTPPFPQTQPLIQPRTLPTIQTPNFSPTFQNPSVALPFDPYSAPNNAFPVFPSAPQPTLTAPQPFTQPPVLTAPNFNPSPFAQTPLPGYNTAGPNPYAYQGTNSNWLPSVDWSWAQRGWDQFTGDFLPRLFERPRLRHTFIHGNDGNELGINDSEFASTIAIPRFLGTEETLRVSPGFIASFWDGPETPATGFDLPASAFSAYLSFDHVTDTRRNAGFDNNFTIGVYSDYQNFSSDSLRLTGRLVGWRRINEYMVGKLGVEYFDRIRIKLLPVVGVYATPNDDMKLDLTFPRSKLSHRIPNVGNYEGWVYVGGEYGGGSWAIERIDGQDDQADINDVRAYIGMEWMGPRRVTGFADLGYVFQREIVYRSDPRNDLDVEDGLMFRAGFAF